VFRTPVAAFYLSKQPVTNLQYEAFDARHVRSRASPGDDDAATGIDFHAARGYCAWYARLARKPIRLPAEIEWEYACRAGAAGRWFFGDDPRSGDAHMWDASNSGGRPGPAVAKRPNPWGLLGMLGGVWEWTASLWLPYPVVAGDGRDDPDRPGRRVLRGGSFREERERCAAGTRWGVEPGLRRDDVGFRIARSFHER
jgi:formylglycine-generating enzyme required for sulfatase activity